MFGLLNTSKGSWGTKLPLSSGSKAKDSTGKAGTLNARVQRQLELVAAVDCPIEYRKGSANGIAVFFLARLSVSATEYDRRGLTSFNPVGLTSLKPIRDSGVYLLRTGGLSVPSLLIPGVNLGGLVPLIESTALGGLVPRTKRTGFIGLVPLTESSVVGGLVPR